MREVSLFEMIESFIYQDCMLLHKFKKKTKKKQPRPLGKVKELTNGFWAPVSSRAGQRNSLLHNIAIFNLDNSCTDFTPLSARCSFLSQYNLTKSLLTHHVPRGTCIERNLTRLVFSVETTAHTALTVVDRASDHAWSVLTASAGRSHALSVL